MISQRSPDAPAAPPLLQLEALSKAYASLLANDQVDLTLQAGERHALIGENGAGKSTLVKMIYGLTRPSSGRILFQGQSVQFASPREARRAGIGMVLQHFALFDTLSVAENIALALPPKHAKQPDLADQISELSTRYGLPVNPNQPMHQLSVGQRQRVEIIRSLMQQPRLLILDEPTSVLTPQAVTRLFDTLFQIADEGCALLYISHKLHEVKTLCTQATVLRQGKKVAAPVVQDTQTSELAEMMVGRELTGVKRNAPQPQGPERLRLSGLSLAASSPFETGLNQASLSLHAGRIHGIAGVSGSGQALLLQALSGERLIAKDSLSLDQRSIGHHGPTRRRKLGLHFIPEERLGRGAVPPLSLSRNSLLTAAKTHLLNGPWIAKRQTNEFTQAVIDEYRVKAGGTDALATSLSGGNLQKYIVGRELKQSPEVLIVAQPTWGVDIGAAQYLRQALIELAQQGTAILVVSEELDELFEVCHSLQVMASGELSPSLAIEQTDAAQIGLWMSGLWPNGPSSRANTTDADVAADNESEEGEQSA